MANDKNGTPLAVNQNVTLTIGGRITAINGETVTLVLDNGTNADVPANTLVVKTGRNVTPVAP